MAIEVEIKARIPNPDELARRLAERGEFLREYNKVDRYYGRPDEERTRFRLRRDGQSLICTFKEKAVEALHEENRETEFIVSDGDAFERFAEYLGFQCIVEKQKIGRSWLINSVRCELSEVSRLGSFLELEIMLTDDAGESERDAAKDLLFATLRDLGIDESAVESKPYTRMIHEDISRRNGVPCRPV